jgi:hypothetical protein
MRGGILLLGEDLAYLAELSSELRSVSRSVIISAAPRPVRRALRDVLGEPGAAIVCLDGSENVADVRSLMSANPATTFLFLSQDSPPRASMAHAVHGGGGEILSRAEEPLVVITATLIALMAQVSEGTNGR